MRPMPATAGGGGLLPPAGPRRHQAQRGTAARNAHFCVPGQVQREGAAAEEADEGKGKGGGQAPERAGAPVREGWLSACEGCPSRCRTLGCWVVWGARGGFAGPFKLSGWHVAFCRSGLTHARLRC